APIGGVVNTDLGNIFVLQGTQIVTDRAKQRFPDLVSNWRIDQAWGSAQIMFAAHDVSAGYYGAGNVAFSPDGICGVVAPGGTATTGPTGTEICGHPADRVGWAAGAGFKVNTFGGSYFQMQANYTQGAVRYAAFTAPNASNMISRFSG